MDVIVTSLVSMLFHDMGTELIVWFEPFFELHETIFDGLGTFMEVLGLKLGNLWLKSSNKTLQMCVICLYILIRDMASAAQLKNMFSLLQFVGNPLLRKSLTPLAKGM